MIEEKVIDKVGIIYLNRPEKLNAINLAMVERMYSILKKWEDDENIKVILFDSLVKKGFSAGGDLKEIYTDYLVNDNCKDKSYLFKKEYKLDEYINSYKKPIISHWQGIVMGGGVGLTINSDLIICEPNVKWAMPETSLGFVPEVGLGKYISKLPQALGQYVGLCGLNLSSSDLVKYKLADLVINENNYQFLLEKLFALSNIFSGDELINEFQIEARKFKKKENNSILQKNLARIDKYFSYDCMEEIYNNLKVNLDDDFALVCYENLSKKDPFILTVQFEKYFVGKSLDYNQTLDLDLKIVKYAIKTKSIHEGIRAKIIDKDNNPNWPHKSFQEVSINEVKDLLLS